MAKKTAKGLVEYAYAQLGKPYWFGTFGNIATPSLLATKRKQYPRYYDQSRYKVKFETQYNQRVHDCIGLIKGYLWSDTPTSTPKYVGSQDIGANAMLGKCKEAGNINTIPEIAGLLVFFKGHIGVYVGNGEVIEARGHDYGVVKTKLKSRPWTHWGKCPYIEYGNTKETKPKTNTTNTKTTVKKTTTTKTSNATKTKTNKNTKKYFKKYTGKTISIVNALNSIKVNSSYSYRKQIAIANGINNYRGSPAQNIKMLNLLKQGKLIVP